MSTISFNQEYTKGWRGRRRVKFRVKMQYMKQTNIKKKEKKQNIMIISLNKLMLTFMGPEL